jgi:TolB-like protein
MGAPDLRGAWTKYRRDMSEPPRYQFFFAELKRRKVFRSIAFYGAGVFVALQLADIVFPAIGVPETAITWLVVASVLGLPAAVAVAWTFDLTSHGLQRTVTAATEEIEAIASLPRSQRWPAGILALAGVGLLMTGSCWVGQWSSRDGTLPASPAARETVESVAVLPFVNIGADPVDEPFSEGLAEELGNALARIEGLRVAARSSSFAFKGRDVDVRQVGRELGVGAVVEGSVRRSGGSVRVSAQLSRTNDGFRLWSNSWERELTAANVFAIQDEITSEIAGALTRELRPESSGGFADRRTEDLEAYDMYLIGRHRWATRNVSAVRGAIGYYEQAIVRDSGFALAWAGLADAWGVLPFYDRTVPGVEAYPMARIAADRALALAPDLAEANAARGIIATEYEFEMDAGRRLLARAIGLNPNYAQAHTWYCENLLVSGRGNEALARCEEAVQLDPVGLIPRLVLAATLASEGRTGRALAEIDRALEIEPEVTLGRILRAGYLLKLGRPVEAAESLEALARREGASDPASVRAVAAAYPGASPSPGALAAVRGLERDVGPGLYYVAVMYDWAGSEPDAIRVVEDAVAARNPWLGMAAAFIEYDGLRRNARFAEILEELGLPNGGTAWRRGRRAGAAS